MSDARSGMVAEPGAETMHLVVPGPLDQRTGGYLYDARMVRGLRERGFEVRVHELPGDFPSGGRGGAEALEGALAGIAEGATVVVDGLAMGALPGAIRAHTHRLRLICLLHHPLADETGASEAEVARLVALEGEALRGVRGVIVTSPFTAGRVAGLLGVDAARLRTVVPGTDPAPRAAGPGPGEPPRILCVGTVAPRKEQDVLVGALARLTELPWRCTLAGRLERAPEYAASVRMAIRAHGLEDRIEAVGELSEEALDRAYASATVFALPSHFEGYGMAITEALARGLPVVSTTGGAIPGTLPPGAGLVVAPGDPEALAEGLRTVLAAAPEWGARAWEAGIALPRWGDAVGAFAAAVRELSACEAPARPEVSAALDVPSGLAAQEATP